MLKHHVGAFEDAQYSRSPIPSSQSCEQRWHEVVHAAYHLMPNLSNAAHYVTPYHDQRCVAQGGTHRPYNACSCKAFFCACFDNET